MNSIKDATNAYIEGCKGKVAATFSTTFVKAIMAGFMIALGAAGSNVAAHAVTNVGLSRTIAGCVFPMGLMMVIFMGAELFTGDCMAAMATMTGKINVAQTIKLLVIVYIGNFVGGALMAYMAFVAGQWNYSSNLLGAYTIKVALGKATISFPAGISSGILCNILVCAAVIMALCAKEAAGKLLVSFFIILLFVTSGYEHCVANMYYITAGLIAKTNPAYVQAAEEAYGITAESLANLNVYNFLVSNLIPVTIGNILGGMVFVGLPLAKMYGNKEN